jgi:voltage-gated potassium channel Kch
MTRFTAAQRLRYWFDNTMSAGTVALIGWLFVASALMILAFSSLVHLTGLAPAGEDGSRPGLVGISWASLMRTLDAGTMGGDTGSWPYLFTMLGVTLGGIFVVGTLIGILTSGIESKIEELRKGRSQVVEEGHTVILGWSTEVFTIVSEVCAANSNKRGQCIAVLADRDKVEMEDEIRLRVPDPGPTRVVCRRGNPADLADLALVNPQGARAIVIVNPDEDGDSHVIKSVLALVNDPARRPDPYHIVATLRHERNLQVARMVGRKEAQFVLADDLIARITVQTCRQSGLSVVYTELMDFGGDEIYFTEEPSLVGQSFGDALLAYEDSSIIGLRHADGRIALNPPMDTKIGPGDRVIAISEDDDTVKVSGRTNLAIDKGAISAPTPREAQPERTLLLGWNDRARLILRELDAYVAPGSAVTVVVPDRAIAAEVAALPKARNLEVQVEVGDASDRSVLDAMGITGFDHIIALSPGEFEDPQEADSHSLITLLHLRDIADHAKAEISIVSEMRDVRNRELASVTRADDFIVSDRLLSLLLSQVAENRELMPVFEDIFDPEGSEIYLKPAADYVQPGRVVNFYTVVEAARRRGEVALGYRIKASSSDPAKAYGVVVNPSKGEKVKLAAGDRIIVLAES